MGAKYGQHFLINQHATERIVAGMGLNASDVVLEIGPGKGALTTLLLPVSCLAIVEVDEEMVKILRGKFGALPQVHLYHEDILKFDFGRLSELTQTPFKVVGNLPYNLTSPILRRLAAWDGWHNAFVMVQKEVADRLCAAPGSGDYGALTVGMSLNCTAKPVFELSPSSFNPPPKVSSAVVKLTRRSVPLTNDIDAAQRVIQAAFQQRRKTIVNSLAHGLDREKTEVARVLKQLGIPETERPERISVDGFVRLSAALNRI